MRKRFFFLILLFGLLPGSQLSAQNPRLDSLKNLALQGPEDTVRIKHLLGYANELMNSEFHSFYKDTVFDCIRKAIVLSQKLKDKKWMADSYSRLGNNFQVYQESTDSAFVYALRSLQLAKDANYESRISKQYYNLGTFYLGIDAMKSGLYIDSALFFFRKNKSTTQVLNALITKIEACLISYNNNAALLFKAREALGICPGVKAAVYEILKILDEGRKANINVQTYAARITVASYFSTAEGKADTAILLAKEAIDEVKLASDVRWQSYLYSCIGPFYAKAGKFKEALAAIDTGYAMAIKYKLIKERGDCLAARYDVFLIQGDYKRAHECYIIHKNYLDSIEHQNKEDDQAVYSRLLTDERSKQEMLNLKKDKELEKAKSRQQLLFTFFALGGLVVVGIFALSLRKQKKVIEQQKQIVEVKQKEILDSIHYAKRIQEALLPQESYIERNLRDLNKL